MNQKGEENCINLRHKLIIIGSLLALLSIIISLGTFSIPTETQGDQTLLADNFESFTPGTWPSSGGWEPHFNIINDPSNNEVTDQYSSEGSKSLQNKYLFLGSGDGKGWIDNVKAYTPTITWNKNPTFDGSPSKNWKRMQYKWSNDGSCFGELDENKFWGEEYGGAYGKNALTNYQCFGIITYREGNVWDSGWNPNDMSDLPPLKTYGKQIDLNISVKRVDNGKTGPWWFNSRMMYAVNLWFNSSELSKPLVMDIIYDLGPFDYYGSVEDDYAYHYQLNVPYNNNLGLTLGHYMNKGQWYKFHTDVDWHIKNALCNLNGAGFNICYAVDTLELQQAEILLELQGAWGKFEVDNFYINYSSVENLR